jgi:hypothetical protein
MIKLTTALLTLGVGIAIATTAIAQPGWWIGCNPEAPACRVLSWPDPAVDPWARGYGSGFGYAANSYAPAYSYGTGYGYPAYSYGYGTGYSSPVYGGYRYAAHHPVVRRHVYRTGVRVNRHHKISDQSIVTTVSLMNWSS